MKNEATEEVKFQELLLKEENEHYFGRCDVCGEDNGCLSVGSSRTQKALVYWLQSILLLESYDRARV